MSNYFDRSREWRESIGYGNGNGTSGGDGGGSNGYTGGTVIEAAKLTPAKLAEMRSMGYVAQAQRENQAKQYLAQTMPSINFGEMRAEQQGPQAPQSAPGKRAKEKAERVYNAASSEYTAKSKQLDNLLAQSGDYAGYGADLEKAKTSTADAKAKMEEAADAYRALGGTIETDNNQRVGKTIAGGAENYLASLLGTVGSYHEGGVRGSKAQIERDLADLQTQADKAQQTYDEMLAKYGDENNVNVKAAASALAEIKSNQELYQGMLDNQSLERTSQAIYGASDRMAERGAQNIAEAKEGLGAGGQFLVDTGAAGVQLLGDIALGKVTGLGMMPVMGARSYGGGSNEARQAGATYEQQFLAGGATAAVEMLTEKLADGLAGVAGKGAADDAAKEIIRRWAKTDAGRTALRAVYGISGEAGEEAISTLVSPLIERIYNDEALKESYGTAEGRKQLLNEALHDALVGGALGGLGTLGSLANGQNAAELADMRMRDSGADVGSQTDNAFDVLFGRMSPEQAQAREAAALTRLNVNEQAAPAPAVQEAPAPVAQGTTGQDALLEAAGITPAVQEAVPAPTAPVEQTTPETVNLEDRQAQIQQRLDEISAELDNPNIDDARADELMAEGETLYAEKNNVEQQIQARNTQQERIDSGDVSKRFGEPENHIDNRTNAQVERPSVKAFQYDHPELHQHFVEAAQALANLVQSAQTVDTTVQNRKTTSKYYENKRNRYADTVRSLVELGLTKPEILQCCQDIIDNNGAENYSKAKKVELVLNDMLTNGYTTADGIVEPNADYIAAKEAINGAKAKPAADSWEAYLERNELALSLGEVTEEQLRAEWEAQQAEVATEEQPQTPAEQPAPAPAPAQEAQPAQAGQTTAEATNGQGKERERGMAENLRNNDKADPALREAFEQQRETYTQLTNSEVVQKADAIISEGFDAAKRTVQEAIGAAKAGAKFAPEMAVAGYQLANEMSKRGDIDGARELCADIAAELTYAGQLGQIGRVIIAFDSNVRIRTVQKLVDRLSKNLTGKQRQKNIDRGRGDAEGKISVDKDLLNAYANAETDEAADAALDAIKDDIAAQIPATFRDKFTALRYLNMLGNLKTQVRNIIGNTAMMAATNVKYTTQAVNELVASAVTGGKYDRNTALVTSAQLRQQAAQDFNDHIDEIKGERKFSDVAKQAARDIADRETVWGSGENSEWASKLLSKATRRDVEVKKNVLEDYLLLTNWAMDAGDVIFMKTVYTRSFAGWMQAHGVKDVANATPDQLSKARKFATNEAREATFHDDNAVSNWVAGLGRGENVPAFIKAISEGVMPFRKTPANVAYRAFQYSPVGVAETIYKGIQAATGKGDATAADVINSLSKNVTGSALMLAGWFLAAAGMARGSNDDDKELSAFEKMQGAMDYSVKIGGRNISLSQFAPMAIPFFMGVKLNELMERSDEPLSLDDAKDILGIVTDPMLEMSMLSGVNDFLNDLSSMNGDTDAIPSLVTNAALGYLSQGLTNSLLGQFEQASEENRQTTYTDTKSAEATEVDKRLGSGLQRKLAQYAAKTPGIDYNQQDYVDAWGRTISNGGTAERYANALLNPTYMSKDSSTEVDAELERLYTDNKDVEGFPDVLPKKRARSAPIGDGIVMTPDEYLQFSKDSGAKKLELVKDFMGSDQYKGLTDQQRAEIISDLYSFADSISLDKIKENYKISRPTDWDRVKELEDPVEYLAGKEILKQSGSEYKGTPDYSQVDSLFDTWNELNDDTRAELSRMQNVNNMLYAYTQKGVGSADYFRAKNTVETEQETNLGGKTGGSADAIALAANYKGTDEEKLAALESLNQPDKQDGKRAAIVRRFEVGMQQYGKTFDEMAQFEAYIQDNAKNPASPTKDVCNAAGVAIGLPKNAGYTLYKKAPNDENNVTLIDDFYSQNYVPKEMPSFTNYLANVAGYE